MSLYIVPPESPIKIGSKLESKMEREAYNASFPDQEADLVILEGSRGKVIDIHRSPEPNKPYITIAFDPKTIKINSINKNVTLSYELDEPTKFLEDFTVLEK